MLDAGFVQDWDIFGDEVEHMSIDGSYETTVALLMNS